MTQRDDGVYVKHILDAIKVIEGYLKNKTLDDLRSDKMLQDATIREIEIIGEAAARVSQDYQSKYPEIDWQKASDMRNRLIHGYDDVNLEIVWQTYKDDLHGLKSKLLKLI